MGNISSDIKYFKEYDNNDFEIVTDTNNKIYNNELLLYDLKNIETHYNKLYSIYKDILKEKIE